MNCYPEMKPDQNKQESYKTINNIVRYLKHMFPNHTVLKEQKIPVNYNKTNEPIVFDIYIPSINLAIEYQGNTKKEKKRIKYNLI